MKPRVTSEAMRVRAWPILQRAVEEGTAYGYRRAHKHLENPGAEEIQSAIVDAVLTSISEVFVFGEDEA